jgi:hypothetical protein
MRIELNELSPLWYALWLIAEEFAFSIKVACAWRLLSQ